MSAKTPTKKLSVGKKLGTTIFRTFILLFLGVIVYFLAYYISRFNFSASAPSEQPAATVLTENETDKGIEAVVPPTPVNVIKEDEPDGVIPAVSSLTIGPQYSLTGDSDTTKTDSLPNIIDPTLTFGTFFDTFSSEAFMNFNKTTLYQDKTATALFFPPDYSWQTAAEDLVAAQADSWTDFNFNNFKGPYFDRRCLGADCLEQRWGELYYNDRPLALPAEVKDREISAISFFSLAERWVVGFTLKNTGAYQGLAFYFDGREFTPLLSATLNNQINSSYFGLFGGGGEESDFLLIYGAYKGIAYRVRPEGLTDISRFFDIRVMANGFQAEAIKATRAQDVAWYVFSTTLSRPRLIKLWQNGGEDIIGEAVFSRTLGSVDAVAFRLAETAADKYVLLAKTTDNDQTEWKAFVDRGFKNNTPAQVEFNPLARAPQFSLQGIAKSRLNLDAASAETIKLSFSTDGQNWQELPAGTALDFVTPSINQFFLRAVFPAWPDKFHSPFLADVLFDYYYRK